MSAAAGPPAPSEHGRRSEWGMSDGNQTLQNRIADQLAWQVQVVGKSDQLDFMIQSELYKFRQDLGSHYTRGQRGFTNRSDRLAMLESLEHVSKWNQEFMHIDRETRETQRQIREELAVIDALLRRTEMHNARAKTRSRRRSSATKLHQARRDALLNQPKLRQLGPHEAVLCVGMAAAMTTLGLNTFDVVHSALGQERFAHLSGFAAACAASLGYFVLALKDLQIIAAVKVQPEDYARRSGPLP